MTEIKINWIHYKNFKGFKDYKLELNGQSARAIGPNGSGKTSLADGLLWLLFGKDTTGMTLNPKPLDDDNNEILGLEPTIEAELVINGETTKLKRVVKEYWSAKRGELEKTRGNDKTFYYIDEVPLSTEREWKEFINKINNPIYIQLMIDASFFMRTEWKQRREILINLTGLTDEEIINMDPELKELEKVLDGKTIDEKKKMLMGEKTNLKKDIEGLPGRIQENVDMIERLELDNVDKKTVEEELSSAQKELEKKEQELSAAENSEVNNQFNEEVSSLKTKLSEAKNKFLTDVNFSTENLQREVSDIQNNGIKLRGEQGDLSLEITSLTQKMTGLEKQQDIMREEYREWKAMSFDEHKKECAMCGQNLPEDKISGMVEKFNAERSDALEKNIAAGKKMGTEIKELGIFLIEKQDALSQIDKKIEQSLSQYNLLNEELERQRISAGTFEESKTFKEIKKEIDEVQQKILNAKAGSVQDNQKLIEQRDVAKEDVQKLIKVVMKFDQVEPIEQRIKELKEEDGKLKAQNQEVEKQLWLIDEFTRKKVKYLTDSINNHFEKVEFKLFEVQKNEAIKEVCEATYNGVGYSEGASTGERGKCDLDIVSGLSRGLNIQAPLFLDNAESITTGISFNGQLIQLLAKDEEFRVEVGG